MIYKLKVEDDKGNNNSFILFCHVHVINLKCNKTFDQLLSISKYFSAIKYCKKNHMWADQFFF